VGFEPTIPAFERAKRVNALDRAFTVIGDTENWSDYIPPQSEGKGKAIPVTGRDGP
jgi:hypothetical protein